MTTEGLATILSGSLQRAPWGWAGLFLLIGTLIKVWPILNDQLIKVKEKRRSDKREDMAEWRNEMRKELDELKVEAKASKEAAHRLENRLVTVVAAFQMIAGELRKLDPDNGTLKQAIDLVGLAVTDDLGMNRALTELSRVPGTMEHPQ